MEWRRAMLEVVDRDSNADEPKSSIHGDLYDTLFTIQTLNSSRSGVEELLARVRSVYESRSVIGKSFMGDSSKNNASGSVTNGSSDQKRVSRVGAYSELKRFILLN